MRKKQAILGDGHDGPFLPLVVAPPCPRPPSRSVITVIPSRGGGGNVLAGERGKTARAVA